MRTVCPTVTTLVQDLTAGELVCFPYAGTQALAIFLGRLDNGHFQFGVLNAPDPRAAAPFHEAFNFEGVPCASFGTNWELELVFNADSFPGNYPLAERDGVVQVGRTKTLLRLGRPPGDIRGSAGTVDLATLTFGSVPSEVAPYTEWNIWAKRGDREVPGARPVFSFKLPAEG